MPGQSHWNHADWKHDDQRRFQFMLGLSVLLHLALLLAWKLPPPVWKAADQAVLTVVLRGVAPLAQSSPRTTEPKPQVAVLVQKDPAPSAFAVPPKPAVSGSVALPPVKALPAPALNPARQSAEPTPGRISTAAPGPVGVRVTLVVGDDGRVNQIFFDTLPALSDEQLRRVEAAIRGKSYSAGQTVHEIFDVRGFLKLPPERPQPAFAPPSGGE